MTLNYGIFDVSDPQNPDRVYSAALLSRILSKHIRDGIVHGDGGELAVTVTDPPAMSVQVGTGTAMVQGRFCESDDVLTLAVPAADTTYTRIDRAVVRLSASPGRTIDILVKKGTPAPSPVPPGLTRTAETWELSLAQIFVAAGATMVQAANITDERGNASLCGVAAPVYVPSSQLEVVGAMNMQGHALAGLPAPSASADAARKGYVDTEIARAIGGFGISQVAIDANKNWNGKNITNVGQLQANSVTTTTVTLIPEFCIWYQDNESKTTNSESFTVLKTAKAVPAGFSGIVTVHWDMDAKSSEEWVYAELRKNGSVVKSRHLVYGGYWEGTDDVAVTPGNVISIAFRATAGGLAKNNKFEIQAIPMPGPGYFAPW